MPGGPAGAKLDAPFAENRQCRDQEDLDGSEAAHVPSVTNDYALEELGPRAFEQLAVALAAAVIGAGVEAFGSGKDGGREATFTGRIPWTAQDGGQTWEWHPTGRRT